MQAEDFHDSVRPGLIALLPRLKRFADVLVGERQSGMALLRRALNHMLAEQHRYRRGTSLDVWAFAEIYRHWLRDLRAHANPMGQAKTDEASFERLLRREEEPLDALTAAFLGNLPPPQRLTLLLVYGEGLNHEDAGRVLDVPPDTIATRLIRASASLADRLSLKPQAPASATIETLYPEGVGGSP